MARISSKIILVAAMAAGLWGCQTPPQTANPASALAPVPLPAARARYVVFFTPWSAKLDGGAHSVISYAAHQIAKDSHAHVTVTGYADPKGTGADNIKLSSDRAQGVADALAHYGVDKNSIVVKSMGSVGFVVEPLEARRAVIAVDD
ncbi:MAG TPA: OmpA family protein [Rhizomicrobium sp.]|jgi:outer membrane protein OmpA-like peptidoglycan-associated protein